MTNSISFTIFNSYQIVSKSFWINDGKIEKDVFPYNVMSKGTANRVTMPFKDFIGALNQATEHDAFAYGLHDTSFPDEVVILTRGNEQPEKKIISRTKEYYEYRKQSGILMLDHDPEDGYTYSSDELIDILKTIDPALNKVAMIVRGSISAGVHFKGKKPKKGKGFHIFIPVCDATDIKRYGKLLYEHLWLKGYGYYKIGVKGDLLERTVIDEKVFRGEGFDFVGKPNLLDKGLEYTPPIIEYKEGRFLDTSLFPDLSEKQQKKLKDLKKKAKAIKQPDAKDVKESLKKYLIKKLVKDSGIPKDEATKLVDKVLNANNELYGKFILYFVDGREPTVDDVLQNPIEYDQQELFDPFETHKKKAKFFWNNGLPVINSFAKGGQRYYLKEQKIYEGVPSYYDTNECVSVDEAIELLENYVDEWMTNPTSNLAIKAPAGIGKSTVILKHVAIEAQTKYIELYVYTHELAEQMKAALLKLNKHLNVVVVRGRTNQKSEKSLPLCDKHELVNKISGYGYNIYETLCKDCEYNKNESCKYLAQYNDDVNVRIFNHAHLPLSRGALAKKYPDFAVIDETFYIRMLLEYEFTFDQIEQHIKNAELSETIIESLKNKAPLLISLKETIGDNLVSVLQSESNNLIIKLPKITDPFFEKKLTQNLKIKLQLSKMLGQLALEVENFPERKHAATVKYVQNKVIFRVRQDLTRFNIKKGKQVPVLCIDADYEQKLGKLFFKIKQKELYVNRNVYVTQTYTTQNSKKRVLPKHDSAEKTKESAEEHIKNLQQIINNVIKEHGNTLVVSYLSLVGDEKLKIESKFVKQAGCEFAHFGALRGLNKFEHCNAAIIIGRHQLPFDVVDSQAAAMWWDSKKELVLTDRPKNDVRGYVSKFKVLGVKVAICNDWRSNLLLELQREREALQAIDRLRVIREVKKKYVYILSSVPLNISVNKLVKHSDLINGKTAIERALLASPHNVLLLSPTILAKTKPYSDIFKSIDNTNKELKKEGLSDREEVNYLLKYKRQVEFNFRRFNIILYRVVGERGGHKKALAPCSMRINIVKKHLQTLHHKSIIIIDSTYTGGFAAIEVKPTKEDIFDILYQHERYYNNKIGEWCIDV